MKNLYYLFVVGLFFLGCKQNQSNFFDFESVEYYSIDENSISYFTSSKEIERIVLEDFFSEIPDENFTETLERIGYHKIILDNRYNKQLNTIFKERSCKFDDIAACAPIFRDILIFKKNNQITGLAKICFQCNKSYFVGTSKNTEHFDVCGNYAELEQILNKP